MWLSDAHSSFACDWSMDKVGRYIHVKSSFEKLFLIILNNKSLVLKCHWLVCYRLTIVFTFFVILICCSGGKNVHIFHCLLYGMPTDQLQEYSLTSDYPRRSVSHNLLNLIIDQFWYIKIHPKKIDLSMRLWGI